MRSLSFLRQTFAGLRVLLVLTVVVGLAYPLAVTAVAQVVSPGTANGSRVEVGGKTVGSTLIAQPFDGAEWFRPRPSAAGENGYDAGSSSPSNLGPNNKDLELLIRERRTAYAADNGVPESAVPVDALTASGSGLDPHISVANARAQAARVARARGLDATQVQALVGDKTQGRIVGVLGDERVGVLDLNLALTKLTP